MIPGKLYIIPHNISKTPLFIRSWSQIVKENRKDMYLRKSNYIIDYVRRYECFMYIEENEGYIKVLFKDKIGYIADADSVYREATKDTLEEELEKFVMFEVL